MINTIFFDSDVGLDKKETIPKVYGRDILLTGALQLFIKLWNLLYCWLLNLFVLKYLLKLDWHYQVSKTRIFVNGILIKTIYNPKIQPRDKTYVSRDGLRIVVLLHTDW